MLSMVQLVMWIVSDEILDTLHCGKHVISSLLLLYTHHKDDEHANIDTSICKTHKIEAQFISSSKHTCNWLLGTKYIYTKQYLNTNITI